MTPSPKQPDYPKIWRGSATLLHETLNRRIGEKRAKARGWPQSASALSNRIERANPLLRATLNPFPLPPRLMVATP
jgi:hypothetical protein